MAENNFQRRARELLLQGKKNLEKISELRASQNADEFWTTRTKGIGYETFKAIKIRPGQYEAGIPTSWTPLRVFNFARQHGLGPKDLPTYRKMEFLANEESERRKIGKLTIEKGKLVSRIASPSSRRSPITPDRAVDFDRFRAEVEDKLEKRYVLLPGDRVNVRYVGPDGTTGKQVRTLSGKGTKPAIKPRSFKKNKKYEPIKEQFEGENFHIIIYHFTGDVELEEFNPKKVKEYERYNERIRKAARKDLKKKSKKARKDVSLKQLKSRGRKKL